MKTPGPFDPSLRIINASADRGAGPTAGLKVGAFVFIEVRERLGGELYRVAVGGRLIVASSAFPLEPGSTLRARVERSGDGLGFRIQPKEPPLRDTSFPALPGLPGDAAARQAAAALLREGLAPEARSLARVRRAAIREADSGDDALDLAARMEAKGIPSDEETLGELLMLSRGGGGSEGGGGEGRGKRDEGGDRARGALRLEELVDLEEDFILDISEEEFPRRLARLLRAMTLRVGEGGEGGDSLSLFNHLPGREGHWIIVPFRFDADSVAFKGGLRIQLPYLKGGQGRLEASFQASRGSLAEEWSFFASFGGGRPPSFRIEAPRGGASLDRARSRLDALARSLAVFACSVHISERGEGGARSAFLTGGFDLDA
jgi:hypothetical protein